MTGEKRVCPHCEQATQQYPFQKAPAEAFLREDGQEAEAPDHWYFTWYVCLHCKLVNVQGIHGEPEEQSLRALVKHSRGAQP